MLSHICATNIRVNASQNGVLYLASYYGKGVNVIDSTRVAQGLACFDFGENLAQGVYFVADKKGFRYDILLGQKQDLSVTLVQSRLSDCKVEGSVESEVFDRFVKQYPQNSKAEDQNILIDKCLQGVDQDAMVALVLNAMRPVSEYAAAWLTSDPMVAYDYKVAHYWDNYDLSDERLLNTPFFISRYSAFLRQVLLPRYDKIVPVVLPLLEQAETTDRLLKLMVSETLSFAMENTIMGIDGLAYALITRYYLSGRLGDLPKKQKAMLLDFARHTVSCRLGEKGKDIVLEHWTQEGVEVSLHHTNAKYTILLFWEPDCAYCKSVIPVLRDDVLPRYANSGLKIFAVNTQRDKASWRAFILDQHLEDWIHGIQMQGDADFMVDYGVQGTPFMYILDEEGRIVAKNVKLDFIDPMLSRLFAKGSIY